MLVQAFWESIQGYIHPSLPTFLEGIKRQQTLTIKDIAEIETGARKPESAECRKRNAKIKNLLDTYALTGDGLQLVKSIAKLYLKF